MRKYDIRGMSCAACSARVEKAVSSLDGVENCSVNLLTNSMTVEGNVPDDAIVCAVEKAGYGASPAGKKKETIKRDDTKENSETKTIVARLVVSAVILLFLMYISMGHNMLSLPVGPFLEGDHA
jgi:Cu2+-exporting ATPase